jgi:hypothetical protein
MMIERLKPIAAALFAGFVFCAAGASGGFAADSGGVATTKQLDAKIITVDQLAVYVPDIVFYWDSSMSKKRIAELTAIANRSRNREVTITYLASGDVATDKRPILVDIAPVKEDSRTSKARDESQQYEKSFPKEEAKATPDAPHSPGYDEESDTQARPEEQPADKLAAVRDDAPAAPGISPISRREANAFVQKVLGFTARKDMEGVLGAYGDQVDYYDRGKVARDYIRKDLTFYFRNWDKIRCSLDDAVEMMDTDAEDMKLLKFTSSFYVENGKKYIMGTTANTWKIQRVGNDLKIVDEKQRVLNSETQ